MKYIEPPKTDRLWIQTTCLIDPNLEHIVRMDVLRCHITHKHVTIPTTYVAMAKGTAIKLPIPFKYQTIPSVQSKERTYSN